MAAVAALSPAPTPSWQAAPLASLAPSTDGQPSASAWPEALPSPGGVASVEPVPSPSPPVPLVPLASAEPLLAPSPSSPPSATPTPRPAAARRPAAQRSVAPSEPPVASPSPSALVSPEELELLRQALGGDGASPPPAAALDPVQQNTNGWSGAARLFQSMNPDISIITDVAGAMFSTEKPLQGGGHDPNRSGFNLQQVEMAIDSSVDPFFAYRANLVYSQFGVEIEEAYGVTTALPENLQLRVGQFLTRMGRLNTTHPHTWEYVDQPFFWSKVYGGEGNRGLGAELNWLAPLPWYAEVATSLTQAGGASTARSFYGASDLGVRSPLDLQATGRLDQFFPIDRDWAVNWGLSGATGPNASGPGNRTDLLATDVYVRWRPLSEGSMQLATWTTEGILRRRQVPGGLLQDLGGYSSLFWRFAWQWGVAARAEWGQNLALDPLDPDLAGDRQRYSTALTYWPSEFSRIRLQGSVDLPPMREPVYGAILGFEFVTGAHGAHKF